MSQIHIFIAGTRALGDQLMEEISSALSPIYTFSYNIEFNSETAKELENSAMSIVACTDEEQEEQQIATKIGHSIMSECETIDIIHWNPNTGASTLRLILDRMMLRYLNMVRKSRGEPPLSLDPEYHDESDQQRYSHLIDSVVQDEDGTIDIDATNLKIKSHGFRITTYADGKACRMGYIFRPLDPEDEVVEEEESRLETLEEPEKDEPIVATAVCTSSGCDL